MSTFDFLNDKQDANQDPEPSIEYYKDGGAGRAIGFVLDKRKQLFLSYSYLISGEFDPEAQTIILTFTTHIITLTGIRLEPLYADLMAQTPRLLIMNDARYNDLHNDLAPIINGITVVTSKE